jgi:sugar diacid utilization regulator
MGSDLARVATDHQSRPTVVPLTKPGARPKQVDAVLARTFNSPRGERVDVAPLQRLVDSLASSLGRPVVLDDARLHLLAHSEHGDAELDRVRLASILQRGAPPDVERYLRRAGIESLIAPARIESNQELGMKPRLCCPVRWNASLLGFLWLIDDRAPLRLHEIEECRVAAAEAAVVLHEAEFLVHASRRLHRRLLVGLLTGPPAEVERSATEVDRLNLVVPGHRVAVLVARARSRDGDELPDDVRSALDAALERCIRLLPPRRALAAMHEGRGVLVVTFERGRDELDVSRLAERLHALLLESFAGLPGWEPVVGVGPFAERLACADESYRYATAAAHVGAAMHNVGPVARWDRLGVFRALSSIPPERVAHLADIHEGLAALADTSTGESLVETAETYLDLGSDARAAASALHLHRSTLYYRLSKCEEVAGVNLRDGGDRLAFHLAVKLARLAGHLDRSAARA